MAINQIKGGIVLNYVIIGLNIVLGLLYTPYMLRMLGQNEYGLYSLVASIIAYLTLLDFGFGNAIVRYTAKLISEGKQKEQWELNGMFIVIYSLIGLLAVGVGIILYNNVEWLFDAKMTQDDIAQAKIMIVLLIINLALTFPLSVYGSIIVAYQDFIFQKILTLCRLLFTALTIVILLYLGYKAIAMVVVQTIFNLGILFINCIYCFKKLHIKVWFSNLKFTILKEIAHYSFWVFLSQIIDRVYWGSGQFVLGSLIGTTAVAIFSVAILLQQMYMTFSSSISSVLLPKITAMANDSGNEVAISNLFIRTGRIQAVVMALILFGFYIFGSSFIKLWAGNGYTEVYPITLLFFTALFIPTIQTTGYTILQARNQMKFRSIVYLFISICSLILQVVFTKIFGIMGCAYAIGGALILGQGLVMNIYYYKKQKIDIPLFWKETIKIMIAPIVLTLLAKMIIPESKLLCNWGSLLVAILLFTTAYGIIVYLCSLNQYEKQLFKSTILVIKRIRK
ncbi:MULTISPECIES: oligosaccharide flippase family protein [Bacteroidales]|uniref:Polysaccharide biosynthesis protein n=1 Tax=Duncaniella freteri TaxID=2530391 RepID=A0A4Z0V3K2_9BACT|nr:MULTISPECIES: oligosaccharide flippase family protein [Bacteroidales]TGG39291.1 polysaccharide biosynthesis protein [Duncaniella freteri]